MASFLGSETTEERVIREVVKILEEQGLHHSKELNLDSNVSSISNKYIDPVFSIRLQDITPTRGLPVKTIRLNFDIAVNRTMGANPHEQQLKIARVRDVISEALLDRKNIYRMQCRELNRINEDERTQGDAIASLQQFEGKFFQFSKEYKR